MGEGLKRAAAAAQATQAPTIAKPWRIELHPRYINARVYNKDGLVAEVWSGRHASMDVAEKNARMIAEAHPMREALTMCLAALTEEGTTDRQRAHAIRAARRSLDKTAGC